MKKFIIFTLISIISMSLFAAPLQLNLDLSGSTIELFGFTANDPSTSLNTLANAKTIPALQTLSINPADVNTGTTKAEKFYIWWYLYTKNSFSLKCYFNDFKSTEVTTTIPFTIKKGTDVINSLNNNEVEGNSQAKTTLHTYAAELGVNSGCILIDIPSFNYADEALGYVRANYSTNIYLEFTSV